MRDDDDRLLDLDKPGRARQHRFGGALSSRGAIFHLNARTGSRSKGQSARAAAAYIQREAEYSRDRDQAAELVYAESDHMPSWAEAEPTAYWDAADLYERANGRLFKRVEVALPVALSADEQRELAVGFAHSLTDDEQLPYTLAIHAGAGTNPHCHLLISERTNDGLERSPEQWFSRYKRGRSRARRGTQDPRLVSQNLAGGDPRSLGRADQPGARAGRPRHPDRPPQPRSPGHRAAAEPASRADRGGDGSAGDRDRAGSRGPAPRAGERAVSGADCPTGGAGA